MMKLHPEDLAVESYDPTPAISMLDGVSIYCRLTDDDFTCRDTCSSEAPGLTCYDSCDC